MRFYLVCARGWSDPDVVEETVPLERRRRPRLRLHVARVLPMRRSWCCSRVAAMIGSRSCHALAEVRHKRLSR